VHGLEIDIRVLVNGNMMSSWVKGKIR